ncbi:hypothetical protein LTS17_002526 [Exophiala oligosperma]
MNTSDNQVLIIGGGLGGLALGQILQANGVPFQVFERDQELHSRRQGWAVALNDLGDLHFISVNANIGVLDGATILDACTGDMIASIGGVPSDQPGHILRCRRERLREYLAQDLPISTDKQFTHYEEDADGVTAHFNDGTSARGSILVGADGASSRVRTQLLQQSSNFAPFVPIMGSATLPREKFQHLHELGSAGLIAGKRDLRYLVALLSIEPDESSAEYYYAVCYQPPDAAEETAWTASASPESLYDKALAQTKGLPDFLTDIIRTAGVEGIITPALKFVEFVPPPRLPVGRVTLAGDAAHAMMPFQGAGANTALLDVCDLASLLINAGNLGNELEVVSLVQAYSCIICPRGKQKVVGSHASGEQMSKVLGADMPPPPLRYVATV